MIHADAEFYHAIINNGYHSLPFVYHFLPKCQTFFRLQKIVNTTSFTKYGIATVWERSAACRGCVEQFNPEQATPSPSHRPHSDREPCAAPKRPRQLHTRHTSPAGTVQKKARPKPCLFTGLSGSQDTAAATRRATVALISEVFMTFADAAAAGRRR